MQQDWQNFFRPDGSIDMDRALRAGRRARAQALRQVFAGLPGTPRRGFPM